MTTQFTTFRAAARSTFALLLGGLLVSSCSQNTPVEPKPVASQEEMVSVAEFYTPAPSGAADDYFVMYDDDDDVEYSYFIDERDYLDSRDYILIVDNDKKARYYRSHLYVKRGHGYGDHNHIHVFRKKAKHFYRGQYFGIRRFDWTDSLKLTVEQRHQVHVAMKAFKGCSAGVLDSFRTQLKPYRLAFRTRKLEILQMLDSGSITRDSARVLLDSAIVKYEAETEILRLGLVEDLKVCRTELDAAIKVAFTAEQYDIWVRHRGW
jgi:hypothetical protein